MIFKISKIEKYNIVAITGIFSKVIYAFFLLSNTRLLVDILGVDGFAAISIILSLVPWFMLFNFGIPNAIQNKISEYRAKNYDYKFLLSNIETLIVVLLILSFLVNIFLSFLVDKFIFSKYDFVNDKYLYTIFLILSFYAISEIYSKILFAEHKGYIPNLFPMIISIFNFLILILCKIINLSDFNIVALLFFLPYLLIFFIAKYKSGMFKVKPDISIDIIKNILSISKSFFIFSFLANLTLSVDYIIMSNLIEPKEIAIYNVSYRVFSLYLVLYTTFLFALWPVIAELFHQNKLIEIKLKIHKTLKYGIFFMLVGSSIFVLLKDQIFNILTGKSDLRISLFTSILISFYFLLRIWTDTYAIVLQSMNKTNILLYIVPIQAMISIISQIALAKIFGINGIISGIIISFLLTVTWILPYYTYRNLKEVR